jgi:hypothetical protein
MDPHQLYQTLNRKPFVPFRVILKDGRSFVVWSRFMAVVCATYFAIGVPPVGQTGPVAEYVERVNLQDIDRVEDLPLDVPVSGA